MRGLIIRELPLNQILQRRKSWEIRGTNCNLRERIGLIRKGSGLVVGTAHIVDAKGPLTPKEIEANFDKHLVPQSALDRLGYKNVYAWVLADPKKLSEPVPYKHRRGAVRWVTIPHIPE